VYPIQDNTGSENQHTSSQTTASPRGEAGIPDPRQQPVGIRVRQRCVSDKTKDMSLSARNQLPGIVETVRLGTIMAHVVVKVGESQIESVITRSSAEEMNLKPGDSVRVVVKSTEVMIQKP